MSRNTKKIEKLLAKYGRKAVAIEYTPRGGNFEMVGPDPSWLVITDKEDESFEGWTIDDLLKYMEADLIILDNKNHIS